MSHSVTSKSGRPSETTADVRQRVIALLNDALSGEYHSFVGYVLGSNPYLPPGTEKDIDVLSRIRDEENENAKAFLIQLARYRAGPTLRAFRWWKHDLNFLGLDFLLVRAAEVTKDDVARVEALAREVPAEDHELAATFTSVVATKRRHAAEIAKLAATRGKERDARRKAAVAVTAVPMKKAAAAAPAAAKPAAAATGAPPLPGAPKAPPLPGAPRPPSPPLPGAPKPPSPPLPGGGPKPASPPSQPSPPLPPGAPKPPSPPLPSGAPKPPSPPMPPTAPKPPAAPAEGGAAPPAAPAGDAAPAKPKHPPLPPGFKLPPKPGT